MSSRSTLPQDAETYDVLVIGAGISGIAMARFYLEVHPRCRLLILEREMCVGGTWAKSRQYDHFWTQWAHPYAAFSDLPMEEPPAEDMYYGFFRAKYTTDYLERYVDHHSFAGLSIRDRIKFGVNVESVTKEDDGLWQITASTINDANNAPLTFHAAKLAIASGLTSTPKYPNLTVSSSFDAPIIHTLDFARSKILAPDNDVKHVTVLGGGKSAGDMAYAAAKAGKCVSWVVRRDGHGPAFYASAKGPGPFRSAFDLASLRVAEVMSPSIWSSNNWLLRWLHGTQKGADLVRKIFTYADQEMRDLADFKGRKGRGDFEKLEFHTGLLYENSPGGLLNRKDFWDVIASDVEVHYENVSHLTSKMVHLQNGKTIETDALLCGTGWNYSFSYFTNDQNAELGLPYLSMTCDRITKQWEALDDKADKEIIARLPILANPPPHFHPLSDTQPFRLYNSIVPVYSDDRDLVLIGQVGVTNYFRGTECQAIWATAYLDNKVQLPVLDQRMETVAKTVAWSKRRYLSGGDDGINVGFDTMRYCDGLLAQLGLRSHRGFFLRDLFYPTTPADLKGLRDEYIQKFGRDNAADKKLN